MTGPFHEGERGLQARAGARESAGRIGSGIRPNLSHSAQLHIAATRTVILSTEDTVGNMWASVLTGRPGFAISGETSIRLLAAPHADDPAGPRQPGDPLGLLVIDLAARRRLRVNGTVESWGRNTIHMAVSEAYGNCPRYIHPREVQGTPLPGSTPRHHHSELTPEQRSWLRSADTLFIASSHPATGADASHRAGSPGFVDVMHARRLVIPDYPGNNMFNTLGNLAVNPRVGLLFWDVPSGRTLQITGTAEIEHASDRRLHVTVSAVADSGS